MKDILFIATGGTIASKKSENGLKPQIKPDELLTYIPRHGYGYVIGILSAGRLLVHISKVGIAACIPAIDK